MRRATLLAPTMACLVLLLSAVARPAVAQAPSAEESLAAASALFDAGRFAEAAQRLDAFLAGSPTPSKIGPAALALGMCRTQLKQYDQAIPAYQKAIASKDDSVVSIAQLGLGEAAVYAKKYDIAVPAIEAALKTQLKPDQTAKAWYWLGQANFELKRYAPAQEAYEKVTRDFPKVDFCDGAYYGAGLAALKQSKTDVAKQLLKTVIDKYPTSDERPSALLAVAQIAADAKKLPEARQAYETMLADPQVKAAGGAIVASAEDGLVRVLLDMGDYAAAAPRLEALVGTLKPDNPQRFRAELQLGHCRYRQKQYDTALPAYQEAAKSPEEPVVIESLYWGANSELALNKFADAAGHLAQFAAKYPKNDLAPKALLKAGDAYTSAKQNELAAQTYRAVVDKYPQSPQADDAGKALGDLVASINDPAQLAAVLRTAQPADRNRGMLRLARMHIEGKRFPEAAAVLADLLKATPEAVVAGEANYMLGIADEEQQKSKEAAAAYQAAVAASPSAAWACDAQSRSAWLFLDLKQSAQAEKCATSALGLKPDAQAAQQIQLALLQAQLDQQKWDPADATCKALIASNPAEDTLTTVVYTAAWVSAKRGKPDEGIPYWERITTQFPKSQYAPEALIRVGDARMKGQKYDEARDRYQAVITGFPKSQFLLEAKFKLGSALYNLSKYDEAAAQFDSVWPDKTAGPLAPESLYWAGVALDKAGKKPDAIQRLKKLVATYPTHARVSNAKIRLAALEALAGGN